MSIPFISNFEDNLFEASLSRILSHWNNNEFVILTSDRADQPASVNELNRRVLKEKIRSMGLGYVPVDGVGQEEGPDGSIVPTSEKAFLIPNKGREGFLKEMLALARHFNQWGILWAEGDGTGSILTSDGAVDSSFSALHVGSGTFFTRLHQSKKSTRSNSFRLESIRKAPKASGVLEQQSRSLKGELFSNM